MKVARRSFFQKKKPLSRQGIQALYTFTPFKLLRATEDGYSIVLAPVWPLLAPQNLTWRSTSVKNLFAVPITETWAKKVVHPHQLYPQTFVRGSSANFVFRLREDRRNDPTFWRYPPNYLEFNWTSVNASHYCALGWVITCAQERCPQESYCRFMKPNKMGSCKFYRGPVSYASLYNVYPRIQRRFEDPPVGLFEPMLAIRYNELPFVIFRFTTRAKFQAYIDAIVFSPKLAWMNRQPTIFLQEGLGFETNNVHAMELEFSEDVLRDFIVDHLHSSKKTAEWITFKYHLYVADTLANGHIREKRGFDAFDRLDNLTLETISPSGRSDATKRIIKQVQETEISSDIVDFAEILFLHSLAHELKEILVAKSGCHTVDIGYYVEHPRLRTIGPPSSKVRIVIFEHAMGGLGYLKKFADEVGEIGPEALERHLANSLEGFETVCTHKVEKSFRTMQKELAIYEKEHPEIVKSILSLYRDALPNTDVFPHVNSIRRAISQTVDTIPGDLRSLLDDMLTRAPHCWDGCQLCVMFERECNFLPFDQPFLVSRTLLSDSLRSISSMIYQPKISAPLKKGVMREFEAFLRAAQNQIDMATPWISPEIVDKLVELATNNQLKIRLITKEDPQNETQIKSLEKLRELQTKLPNFETRLSQELHAKGMLVDKIMLLDGSFNFTLSGLASNVENLEEDFSIKGCSRFSEQFDALWEKLRPLQVSASFSV